MKYILLSLLFLLPVKGEEFYARLTFYTGSKTASGKKPQMGRTVAAAHKVKFGTTYIIPALDGAIESQGGYVVEDRGPAVDKRTASHGRLPVIDIYVTSQDKVNRLAATKKYHKVLVKIK